jgi:hypothetical protein
MGVVIALSVRHSAQSGLHRRYIVTAPPITFDVEHEAAELQFRHLDTF